MPYVSRAQQGKFHAMEDRGEISHAVVKEFDDATKGHYQDLPKHVAHRQTHHKALAGLRHAVGGKYK